MSKGGVKILHLMRPVLQFLPVVPTPEKRVPLRDRLIWSALVLLLFLVCSQIPLYGIRKMFGDDPMYWSRLILASNRGTLMELGIGPIITASMIVQLLAGAKILDIDQQNKEEKELLSSAQKLLAVVIALFEAFAYVFSGMYGPLSDIGAINALLIIVQLTLASVLVNLLDEILTKGYGIGSAISLFIATNVCEELFWKSFSPTKFNDEYEGAFVALFHYLWTKDSIFEALRLAFYRDQLANLNSIIATVFIFCVVNFFQGFHVNVAIHNKQVKGHVASYSIKLFYTSNMPIILQSTLISNVFFISRLLFNNFGSWKIVRLLGRFKQSGFGGQSYPVSGLVYYLSPPGTVTNMLNDPIRSVVYILFILVSCAIFSRLWIDVSGSSPKDVHTNLKNQNVTAYKGSDKILYHKLKKYITIAASFGGMCIGILSISADILGAIGSGTGILLTCNIIYEFYEEVQREQQETGESLM